MRVIVVCAYRSAAAGLGLRGRLPGLMLQRMSVMSGQVFVDGEPITNTVVSFFLEINNGR